jgi:hypothetical protein
MILRIDLAVVCHFRDQLPRQRQTILYDAVHCSPPASLHVLLAAPIDRCDPRAGRDRIIDTHVAEFLGEVLKLFGRDRHPVNVTTSSNVYLGLPTDYVIPSDCTLLLLLA